MALLDHAELVRALPEFGYTDVWSAETNGIDAFTPLTLTSVWEPSLRLGTAIVPAYTRGPALIAMSAAALAATAPGRFVLGLGASSPVIVGNWNGIDFEEPYRRTQDVLRVVRSALNGERVDGKFGSFTIKRFKLDPAPQIPPKIMLAALRPQMLRLAGREADGAILNWLACYDVPRCVESVCNETAEIVARIFVCPTEDASYAHQFGRTLISTYLTVPAYAAFHDWLGRGPALAAMHEKWAAGDRSAAAAAIPDEIVDDLVLHGSPESVREQVRAYVAAGVDTPVLALLSTPDMSTPQGLLDVVRRLGPGD
ncbi:MAG TPA: LLM class F420-dependent oxidoreductase [Solirubrobacteraceae bacterium]|nr:LLM class F420-dependent oxidoreductase [Solirubrobacteraceae bacterium]